MKRSHTAQRDYGASLYEAAIALPILLTLLLGLIDIARYFLLTIILNYAAYVAADEATKLPVTLDTTATGCAKERANGGFDPCKTYLDEVMKKKVFQGKAARLLASIEKSRVVGSMARLVQFNHYCNSDYPGSGLNVDCSSNPLQSAIGFLRPGEIIREDGNSNYYQHPFRGPRVGATPVAGTGWPSGSENWTDLLRSQPVAVHIEMEIQPLFPGIKTLIGPLRVRATQFANRRSARTGILSPGNLPSGDLPKEIPTALYTLPATSTPGPNPTTTATPACNTMQNRCSGGNGNYCNTTYSNEGRATCIRCRTIWNCDPPPTAIGG